MLSLILNTYLIFDIKVCSTFYKNFYYIITCHVYSLMYWCVSILCKTYNTISICNHVPYTYNNYTKIKNHTLNWQNEMSILH